MPAFTAKLFQFVIAATAVLSLGVSQPAKAEISYDIESWQVQIMPEYDRPEVLVIHRFSLKIPTASPVNMTVRIPTAVGEPYNVAAQGWDGSLYKIEYESKTEGEWTLINFSSLFPAVQIEYYDPRMAVNGKAHRFDFSWLCDKNIRDLQVIVQQPKNASNLALVPKPIEISTGDDGLEYQVVDFGTLAPGSKIQLNIQYNKSDQSLTASLQPVQPEQPLPLLGKISSGIQSEYYQPMVSSGYMKIALSVLGGMGLVFLIIAFLSGFWRPKIFNLNAPKQAPRPKSKKKAAVPVDEKVFCLRCGKLARASDSFCRACGSKL